MSLAPFEMADIRITLTSLMTGASSPCRVSASALISSSSSSTSTSPASMSGISDIARVAISRALSPGAVSMIFWLADCLLPTPGAP